MTHYPIEPTDQIFVKRYGCSSFAKNISKNLGKTISGIYGQKLLDYAKQCAI